MTERRPIASRDRKWAQNFARWLVKKGVVPNHISQASVVFGAIAGLAFYLSIASAPFWLLLAALGVQGRLLCNLFDGMVAIEGGRATPDGAFWNEAPDRYADILILVGMGLGTGNVALGWAAATMAVLTAYTREAGVAQGLKGDFSGPMAKQHRMAVVTIAAVLAAFVGIFSTPQQWPILEWALWLIVIATAITAILRGMRMVKALKSSGG
jgi:phosphatidylglycerophosphate synthase